MIHPKLLKIFHQDDRDLPLLIGITGWKKHGKNTIADHLVKKYNYKKLHAVETLLNCFMELFTLDEDQVKGDRKDNKDDFWGFVPRDPLNVLGTDFLREQGELLIPGIGDKLLVKAIERKILKIWEKNPKTRIVLTNIRFPNEVDLIKKYNGLMIKVKRNLPDDEFCVVHKSDLYIDQLSVDHDLENYSTTSDLLQLVDSIITQ